jgi:hypothetical protein
MTEVETSKLTATELSLKKQQEEIEEKQKSFQETFVNDMGFPMLYN